MRHAKGLFPTFFASLVGQQVIVVFKNDLMMKGKLQFCDDLMNLKLFETEVLNAQAFPQLPDIDTAMVRGSSIKYVLLPPEEVNLEELHSMTAYYNQRRPES